MGRFTLQHRVIECFQVEGGSTTSVRLRRITPEPSIELGYLDRIGRESARLHLYRAEWSAELRRVAKERTVQTWLDATHGESENKSQQE